MNPHKVANWSALEDRKPAYALVGDVDLVVTRFGDAVSVLYGRCAHRGALMSDGFVSGSNLISVLVRAAGHDALSKFNVDDLTTFDRDMAYLTGVQYGGVVPL